MTLRRRDTLYVRACYLFHKESPVLLTFNLCKLINCVTLKQNRQTWMEQVFGPLQTKLKEGSLKLVPKEVEVSTPSRLVVDSPILLSLATWKCY